MLHNLCNLDLWMRRSSPCRRRDPSQIQSQVINTGEAPEDATSIEEVWKEEIEDSEANYKFEPTPDDSKSWTRSQEKRHLEDIAAVKASQRRDQAKDRKLRDICDALLVVPRGFGDQGIDDTLAKFFNVARKDRAS